MEGEKIMFETLKRIYGSTKNKEYLSNAVAKGWITVAQKDLIISGNK